MAADLTKTATPSPPQQQNSSPSSSDAERNPVRNQLRGHDLAAQTALLQPGEAPVQMKAVYRGMTAAGNAPALGESARKLGVRPGTDITVEEGKVKPASGKKKEGMSTSPDSPKNLPAHRRPPEWGGTGKDPVWETTDASLTNDKIRWVQDSSTHGTVEPTKEMPYAEYKTALEGTQGSWSKATAPKKSDDPKKGD